MSSSGTNRSCGGSRLDLFAHGPTVRGDRSRPEEGTRQASRRTSYGIHSSCSVLLCPARTNKSFIGVLWSAWSDGVVAHCVELIALEVGAAISSLTDLGPPQTRFTRSCVCGDVLDVRLGCQTAVIADSYTLSVRFFDKDSLARFDPSFPEIEARFERCKF